MENASKALIIAGAILLSILIIGLGLFIFTNAQGTIDRSLQSMTTQDVNAFNSQFISYQGESVTGTSVKSLLAILSGNFVTYREQPAKVPIIVFLHPDFPEAVLVAHQDPASDEYIQMVSAIRNFVVNRHKYKVNMVFGEFGTIQYIYICDVTNGASYIPPLPGTPESAGGDGCED